MTNGFAILAHLGHFNSGGAETVAAMVALMVVGAYWILKA